MTLEEWKTFCLGKLVRVLDSDGNPNFRGIVNRVRAEDGGWGNPRVVLDLTGNYQGEETIYPSEGYINANNASNAWHIEVWS